MKDFATQYRPSNWDEIVGQDVLVKTLQTQIDSNNVAHAYLFCGPRGTGKTTTAKVFARALNAQVIEIDAASHNGVDNVRDLKQDVLYLPVDNKQYKVYIIDECHMMSQGAFNAFLKLLEEPPKHVIFVLATTDPQKLPNTIISRCQRFDLKRITNQEIIGRLKTIADREQISVENDALEYIASVVDGGMRDAIKLLQKCSALDEVITKQTVVNALGSINIDSLKAITDYILNKDIKATLKLFRQLVSDGADVRVFIADLIQYLTNDITESVMQDNYKILNKMNIIDELIGLLGDLRIATNLRIITELKLIKLCLNKEVMESEIQPTVTEVKTIIQENSSNFDEGVLQRVFDTLDRYEKRFLANEMELDMLKRRR